MDTLRPFIGPRHDVAFRKFGRELPPVLHTYFLGIEISTPRTKLPVCNKPLWKVTREESRFGDWWMTYIVFVV